MSIPILMPALSPTMEEGTLAKWHVKVGDAVKAGDVIAEIETDKATMEVEAVDDGRIEKILVAEGTKGVKVNTPIAMLNGEAAPSPKKAPLQPPQAQAAPPSPAPVAPAISPAPAGRIIASPLARRLARERRIDLSSLRGTGPRGRIVLRDIEAAAKPAAAKPAAMPAPAAAAPAAAARPPAAPSKAPPQPDVRDYFAPGSFEEVPHDSMRKAIARRLTQSMQTIPHFYLTVECDIDALIKLRKDLNDKANGAYKLSVNDFVVRAAALALMKSPDCNVSWSETAMLRHKHADIGVAVAIPGGLITPIIRNTELKGLKEISHEMADLAERARNKKLKPNEYEGGSFAISNLGMYGIKQFTAIINPPHAAILAVGRGEERAVVKAGALAKATVMTLTLSCDHRAIDGATGAQFLAILKGFLEDPATMLL